MFELIILLQYLASESAVIVTIGNVEISNSVPLENLGATTIQYFEE